MQNFVNIKPLGKLPNLQDWIYKTRWKKEIKCEAAEHFINFCNKVNQFNTKYRSVNVTQYLSYDTKIIWASHEKTCLWRSVDNKGADQPAHTRSLISPFVIRLLESSISILASREIPIF